MSNRVFLKPAVEGQVIRHVQKLSHQLAQKGEWVEYDEIWARKVMHGEVVICTPPENQPAPKVKLNAKEGE